MSRLQELYDQGFDESERNEEDKERIHVGCSQCQALVINGVASHERGCPNEKRAAYKRALEGIVDAADDGALGPMFEREDCGDDCICCICDGRRVLEEFNA